MKDKAVVRIRASDASMLTLYNEQLPLNDIGQTRNRRASHVEPEIIDGEEWWTVRLAEDVETETEMFPAGTLIAKAKARSQALAEEVAWLHEHSLQKRKGI